MAEPTGFSENALKILKARYFLKDENGEAVDKGPADLFRRVAGHIASAERSAAGRKRFAEEFFRAMIDRDFLPNSPTLTGAGRGMCLSACFVLPIEDSLDSIFETVKDAALVHKEGGGTGFDFSRLRPRGQLRPQDPGRRLRAGLVPPRHRRRDRGRQAGRDAPRAPTWASSASTIPTSRNSSR